MILTDAQTCCPAAGPAESAACLGYALVGDWWIRVDGLDKVLGKIGHTAKTNPNGFAIHPGWAQSLGLPKDQAPRLLTALGYHQTGKGYVLKKRRPQRQRENEDSPFAVLKGKS